jgi:hypothetical protein
MHVAPCNATNNSKFTMCGAKPTAISNNSFALHNGRIQFKANALSNTPSHQTNPLTGLLFIDTDCGCATHDS